VHGGDYTPNLNFTGADGFTYEICDSGTPALCATAAVAITVTNSVITLTFNPTDDAYVDSKKSPANYGSSTILQARAGAKDLNSYLKFTVVGISLPIIDAKLRLWATKDSSSGGSAFAVSNDYSDSTGPWAEAGLTWANAPAITETPLDTVGPVAASTWVEFDVTGAVSGDGTYSFALDKEDSNVARYLSKEGSVDQQPVLVIILDD
jgi:hypothetical protein